MIELTLQNADQSLEAKGTHPSQRLEKLARFIDHAAHLLPSQGPITVFVHHNTLHAFENVSFDEGVKAGGLRFGCHAYLSEERYREKLQRGRIRVSDLEAVLIDDLAEEADRLIANLGTRFALRLAMLQFPLRTGPAAELRWVIAETDALRRFRPEVEPEIRDRLIAETRKWIQANHQHSRAQAGRFAINVLDDVFEQFDRRTINAWHPQTWEAFCLNFLWRVCRKGVQMVDDGKQRKGEKDRRLKRHRDVLWESVGKDADIPVHDLLIRFCSAFLDQGFAEWELPNRNAGFYRSFLCLFAGKWSAPTRWLSALRREVHRLRVAEISPLESIDESLELLGVQEDEREEFITESLLALRGWAGMVWQMETNAEWTPHPSPAGSLMEFLAVRLMLDRLSVQRIARETLQFTGPLEQVRDIAARRVPRDETQGVDQRTIAIFQLAQVRGWKPEQLQQLSPEQWELLVKEMESFSSLERRRVYHLAYERKYRNETFDAVLAHRKRQLQSITPSSASSNNSPTRYPKYQVVFCIDDREESFRRHLEEVDPQCETFGMAGFFGVAMYFRGIGDAHFKPLCPNSIKPRHYVVEVPAYSSVQSARRRAEARRHIGRATHQAHLGTRTFLGGFITGLFGSLAAFPLVARVLFPRVTSQVCKLVGEIVRTPNTELRLQRFQPEPGQGEGHYGYSLDEMADIVETILRAIGLTQDWSPLVMMLGHGSTSLNNPHESAYNCGACSGSPGGANARVFAQMANDSRVRSRIRNRGIAIPDETYFVGGYHDTTNDSVIFSDLDRIPVSHRPHFERALTAIDETRARNAHERCRRFESASLSISPEEALRHVEARPEDLSQARPEYNHATNALCLVGRREWSRGLFLDRRAFLASYDPRQDDDRGSILEGILRPLIPVCAGISLEYYFSTVDAEGYGCGSKLPHNITSLLGVMTGAASDLRPGLSTQMTEIHEAMRLLFVIESSPGIMQRIIEDNEAIARLVNGNWVQLALFDAQSANIFHYVRGEFVPYRPGSTELPLVDSSADWYRGKRDHLGFASLVENQVAMTSAEQS